MSGGQKVNAFEQIQSLCLDFRRQLKSGAPKRIEDYLDCVDQPSRDMLFQNLLHVEIEFRRRQNEQPTSDEYVDRFPDLARLVRQAFFESTVMSMSPHVETPADQRTVQRGLPGARKLGEYELLRELGRGGFGVVYEARHLHRNDLVALKVLPDVEAEALYKFKREFRSLSDINHRNLIGLHSLESDGDFWFFTMDLIKGTDFLSAVRPNNRFDEKKLRSAFSQLVVGVMALHANYVIHRDLKPSNVMVNDEGQVVLLDFGLVLEMDQGSIYETAHGISGTPAYMAPEQAAVADVTPSSDWYAVGVMLYEALTGRLPFQGSTLEILQRKQVADPAPLSEIPNLPEDLSALCLKLLERYPEQRPDAFEIAKIAAAPTSNLAAPSTEHHLIGRGHQLSQLEDALEQFNETGQPMVVFVDGRSGEGKTTLCEAFLKERKHDSRYAVMSGRCYDRESVPYKALDSTIDAICRYLNGLASADIAAMLPRDMAMLIHLFPVVGRVKGIKEAAKSIDVAILDVEEVRTRAFQALRELLGRIGDRQPIILFIDDLQWGDADSAKILLQLLQPPLAPQVLILGTFRTDEANDSRFLQSWEELKVKLDIQVDQHSVRVCPFTQEECTQLVVNLLQQNNETIQRRSQEFFEQTAGNPFLLTELVGCFDPATDSFRPLPVHEVIEEKLRRLPEEARLLLEVTAVSGQALDMEEASEVAGQKMVPTATLTRMRTERLLRFLGSAQMQRIDTYHDRIRETILAEMHFEKKCRLHRKLGERIERTANGLSESQLTQLLVGSLTHPDRKSDRLFDLSFHFDEAGEKDKACSYGLLAADQARDQYALEVAMTYYQISRKNSVNCSQKTSRRILVGLGKTATLLGHYPEAEESLQRAHSLATNLFDRCEIESLQAELLFNMSRYKASNDAYVNALRSLGVFVPISKLGYAYGLLRELLIQTLHSFKILRFRPETLDRRKLLILELLRGSFVTFFVRSVPGVVWSNLKTINEAEKYGPSKELAIAYSHHTVICATGGFDSRGKQYESLAQNMMDESDLSAQLAHYVACGVGAYAARRYEECKRKTSKAIEVSQKTGDVWKTRVARLHYLLSEYRLGNLHAALLGALNEFHVSVRLMDFNTAYDFLQLVSMITDGHFDYERMIDVVVPIPDNIQATNIGLQAETRWHLAHGRTERAVETILRALELMKNHLVLNHITTSTFPLLLSVFRDHSETQAKVDSDESKKFLKRGYRLAGWAVRFTNNTVDAPATLREMARYHFLHGKLKKALRVVEQSCKTAEKQDAQYELAQSQLLQAELYIELRKGREEDVRVAQQKVLKFIKPVEELQNTHPLLQAVNS